MKNCIAWATLLVAALLFLAAGHAQASELEIDKDGGGIRIIQKRKPQTSIDPGQKTLQEEGAPDAPKDAPPKETPERKPEKSVPEVNEKEGSPDFQEKPDSKDRKDFEQEKPSPESLEDNPEYIAALNKLTEEYNRRLRNLQQESDRLSGVYNGEVNRLRLNITSTERAMELANERRNIELFDALQVRRGGYINDLNRLNDTWRQRQQELRRQEGDIRTWYERRQRELKQEFTKKMKKNRGGDSS